MGSNINRVELSAFFDELNHIEKNASISGAASWMAKLPGRAARYTGKAITGGADTTYNAFRHPIQQLRAGWGEMGGTAATVAASPKGGRISEFAKTLGRHGITGEGKYTKYLPIGMRGMMVPVAAGDAYGVMQAAKGGPTSPTGEGGVAESAGGAVGGMAGMVSGGRRILPSIALYGLGRAIGGGGGRIVDRMRGGADPITAATAPSPTEAAQQFSNIQRYYG